MLISQTIFVSRTESRADFDLAVELDYLPVRHSLKPYPAIIKKPREYGFTRAHIYTKTRNIYNYDAIGHGYIAPRAIYKSSN